MANKDHFTLQQTGITNITVTNNPSTKENKQIAQNILHIRGTNNFNHK